MAKYTCFVISPIGQEGTQIYEEYKDLIDLIIIPALEIYDIKVERGDHSTSEKIDDAVIRAIQEADICICDITEPNPNVYYELGRRDETGKPVLLLKRKGSASSPVDIATRRYYEYSWDGRHSIREAQTQIRSLIGPMIDQGFEQAGKSASLADLAETLRRIERKVDKLGKDNNSYPPSKVPPKGDDVNPIDKFNAALLQRNIPLAEEAMNELAYRLEKFAFYDKVVEQVAAMGSAKAGDMLIDMAEQFIDSDMSFHKKIEYLGCLVSFANRQDREMDILNLVEELCARLENQSEGEDPKDIQQIYNQLNRLYHGIYSTVKQVEWLEKAISCLKKAMEYDPEPYIYYNLAVCYYAWAQVSEGEEYSNAISLAKEYIDRCLDFKGDADPDHLELACQIYYALDDPRLDETLDRLNAINPYAALVLKTKLTKKSQ